MPVVTVDLVLLRDDAPGGTRLVLHIVAGVTVPVGGEGLNPVIFCKGL